MNTNFNNLNHREQLCSKKSNRKNLFWVMIGHVAVIFLPISIGYIMAWIDKKPKELEAIKVEIIDPVFEQTQIQKDATDSYQDPVLEEVPEMVKETPKVEPVVEQPPKVEPKVEPKPTPKVKPKKVVKPKSKPKVVPKKQPVSKQPDLSDLEVVSSIERVIPRKTTTKPTTQSHATTAPISTSKSTNSISKRTSGATTSQGAKYDAVIGGVIYNMWLPPRTAVLSSRKVQSLVRITIDDNGRVIKREILRKSGFAPMDQSVIAMLKKLIRLPRPVDERRTYEFLLNTEDKY